MTFAFYSVLAFKNMFSRLSSNSTFTFPKMKREDSPHGKAMRQPLPFQCHQLINWWHWKGTKIQLALAAKECLSLCVVGSGVAMPAALSSLAQHPGNASGSGIYLLSCLLGENWRAAPASFLVADGMEGRHCRSEGRISLNAKRTYRLVSGPCCAVSKTNFSCWLYMIHMK